MKIYPPILRIAVIAILLSTCINGAQGSTEVEALQQEFKSPTFDSKPWCFWYWMYGAVNKQAITADLEAMKRVGLAGTYLMPIKGPKQFPDDPSCIDQQSPAWWSMVDHALREADRLGLKLGMHICDGFALAGGPWIEPQESMQKVVTSECWVGDYQWSGPITIAQPDHYKDYYEDIAVLAWQEPYDSEQIVDHDPKISVGDDLDDSVAANKRMNMDGSGTIRASLPGWIVCEFEHPVSIQNLLITPGGNNYQAHRLQLLTSMDGVNYTHVAQFKAPRQGWQNTDFGLTFTFAPTICRYAKLTWTPDGSEPGSEDLDAAKWRPNLKIKRLRFSGSPKLNQWEGKTGLVWRVAQESTNEYVPTRLCIAPKDVKDVTKWLHNDQLLGGLSKPKSGNRWHIVRMGHTSTGHTNATGGTCQGLECSKFDRAAIEKQIENWFGAVFKHTDKATAERTLKYMHIDSWECGCQNWSDNLLLEFKKRRGYSFEPFLPLLAGIPMVDAKTSECILRDYRTTMAELVHDVFFDVAAQMADKYDCQLTAECVAPTMVSDGLLHYDKVDLPMGEFWLDSPTHDKPNDMLDAISGAHIYGKNIIQAEGCTQLRGTWDETPASVKPLIDRNLALGINRLFFHVFTLNPYMDRQPGMTLDGIGFFFQRDNTWFDQSAGLVDYVSRCQALLQYGQPVVDLAVFTGEETPRRSILPERLVTTFPGLMGDARVASEAKRLKNEGQPLRMKPVGVSHSANMSNPADWVNPLHGYAYDSFNRDALIRLASGNMQRLNLGNGMCYQALVIPQPRPMNPNGVMSKEVKHKIDKLRKAGVRIIDHPVVESNLGSWGIAPDAILPDGIAYAHRSGISADIYFLVNTTDKAVEMHPSFRVQAQKVSVWNPMDGSIVPCKTLSEPNLRTSINWTLDAYESCFVVLEKSNSKFPNEEQASTPKVIESRNIARSSKWSLNFDKIEKTLTIDTLESWTNWERFDKRIPYFSGTVGYKTTFTGQIPNNGQRCFLYLDDLHDVATVLVNGETCGIAWFAPYAVDVTDALHDGENNLEIQVTNTWANAILGADQKQAPFPGIWTNGKYRRSNKDLLPAGLLSEPRLEIRE